MKGKLYLIPSIISPNTQSQISEHLKMVVQRLSYFLVENVRTTRRYLSSLKIGVEIDKLNFELLTKSTKFSELDNIMKPLLQGKDMGVLSESGCPGIADPGAMAVAWAHKNKVVVSPIVGPSSIFMALMASGFNGQNFCFNGYLPINNNSLSKKLKELEKMAIKNRQTQIIIETPYRNRKLFEMIKQVCAPNTMLCIATDVSGNEENIMTKSVEQWRKTTLNINKIPTVFLIDYKEQ